MGLNIQVLATFPRCIALCSARRWYRSGAVACLLSAEWTTWSLHIYHTSLYYLYICTIIIIYIYRHTYINNDKTYTYICEYICTYMHKNKYGWMDGRMLLTAGRLLGTTSRKPRCVVDPARWLVIPRQGNIYHDTKTNTTTRTYVRSRL